MELLDFPIKLKSSKQKVTIHGLGDIHRAALGCDSKQLRSDISQIKAGHERGELHYWLGTGDWSNAIGPKDKRHDAAAIAPEFQEFVGDNLFGTEASVLASEFKPIAHLGIGMGMGNHEDSIAKYNEYNPAKDIAERLDIPYLGYSAIIRLRLTSPSNSATVLIFWHHGKGAAVTKGGKLNMLYGMRDIVQADVYMVGHVHELLDFPEVRLSVNRRGTLRLIEDEILFINTGTYLKAYATDVAPLARGSFDHSSRVRPDYAEKKGYRPAIIGHNGFQIQMVRKTKGWVTRLKRVDFRR